MTDSSWEDFVASLDDDEECDSALHYDRLEQEGPPAKAIDFPTPTLFPARLVTVKALDHRNGNIRMLENVLMRQPSRSNGPIRGFVMRKKIAKTTYGSIRVAVVLRKRAEDEEDAKEVPWISTEDLVAVKISSWNKIEQMRGQHMENPLREVAALQHVGNYNDHVVGCLESLQDNKFLYTIMPYFNQGSNLHGRLFAEPDSKQGDRLPQPNEEDARTIFRQLLKGLQHLQRKGVFHRDISLDNLLISKSNQLKIVDLGMSLRVPYSDSQGCVTDVSEGTIRRLMKPQGKGGRLMYLAPEILAEKAAFDGFAVDLWAAGVILFVLCVGLAPFKFAEAQEKRYAKISSGGLKSLMKSLKIKLSPEACDLLQNMLWEDPRHRLSLAEVMRHPWVMGTTAMERNLPPFDNAVSSEQSVGSQSSTELVQEYESSLPPKTTGPSPTPATSPVHPEARQSVSEQRDSSISDVAQQVNHRWKHFQQIGPKFMTNAQQMGPRVKNAIANVHMHRPKSNASSTDDSEADSQPSSNVSPPRRILSRLTKTVIPNKTS